MLTIAACGSSPTAPDLTAASTPVLTPDTTGSASTAAFQPRGRGQVSCAIDAILVSVVPPSGGPNDRVAHTLEATYKGDPTGCPDPVWSVFPLAQMVVDPKQPERVTVYDNPENKLGLVDVTATIGSLRLSGTERVQFPRTGR